ncbi:MAG: protein kinase [Planctomycetaceae bacterium]|nr:protein kinase [Planctomycetaceae bacterium]
MERTLLERQIVTLEELQQAKVACLDGSSDDLLRELERRQALTAFQMERIRKGEIDGLVLGGVKLLYRNASGSFARVYRGCRISDAAMIGVKVLRDRWSSDRDVVQLFHREGEIGKRLKHPNIVPIYQVGCEGKHHFIVMDFVEGGNLRDFLKIRGKLEPTEACKYALDIARALQYALGHGMTHRDMKTTNVLMSSQGIAKLIDFGLAADEKMLNRPGAPELAQALEYSTLERNTGAPINDHRSDLFFLGTILYEMLSGEPPYPRTRDREERKRFGRYRDIRPITSLLPSLPSSVVSVVDRLLQVNPAHRYQTPAEVTANLERTLSELGQPVSPVGSGGKAKSDEKTVLLVEHRAKFQDLLRDYFSKHGFRVLLIGDSDRALTRIRNNPPDSVVFFGDAVGDRIVDDFRDAINATRGKNVAVAAVMSKGQNATLSSAEEDSPYVIQLAQPVSLRDLRKRLENGIAGKAAK